MKDWLVVLVVASVWFAHLCVSYFLAWADCATTQPGLLILRHIATALGLCLVITLSVQARQRSSMAGKPTAQSDQAMERSFMMRLTVALGVMFGFATLLAGATNFFLGPCV
jgi:hypothetical protein